ncbi:MAG TPA: DUF4115 domain-containing protein, partial [Terriglobales bacterium]|nr:DUF4115 domain-containing protein [Terriglobales bacterium]
GATTDGQTTGSTAPAATSGSPAATTDGQATAGAGTTPPASSGDQEAENKATGQASSPAPANAAPVATAPATTPQPSAVPAAAAPATAAQPAPEQPATNQAAQAAPAQTAAAPATAPATAGTEAAPEVAAAANSTVTRVSIHAKLESWVQITDKDGKPVLSRVLRAGETYAVPDEKGLTMNTGNAGGIDVLVDGKALPSLGSVGLVKRNIVLDADKLTTGAVTTKTPETKTNGGTEPPPAPTGD